MTPEGMPRFSYEPIGETESSKSSKFGSRNGRGTQFKKTTLWCQLTWQRKIPKQNLHLNLTKSIDQWASVHSHV